MSKRRQRRQSGKRKGAVRKAKNKELAAQQMMWHTLNDTPEKAATRAWDTLVDSIIGVQPMQGPVGEIFELNYRKSDERIKLRAVAAQNCT